MGNVYCIVLPKCSGVTTSSLLFKLDHPEMLKTNGTLAIRTLLPRMYFFKEKDMSFNLVEGISPIILSFERVE